MLELRCEAVRWVDDDPFPGIIEVRFIDAAGQPWSLIDKWPIFVKLDELTPESDYPVEVTVACVIQGDADATAGDGVVTISTSPHGVTTPGGREEFTVRWDQLIR
ncbi:hypothetical protein [Kitasatospora sp. NPDC098663]|uniref:hypothetical protein n=1 Tax=Kitasatospora sp. NPDC098663 TaxID=3364096 RepID=UPI003804EBB6